VGKVFRDLFILLVGIGVFVGACVLALHKNPEAPTAVGLPVPPAPHTDSYPAAPAMSGVGPAAPGATSSPHGHLLYACTRDQAVTYTDHPCPPGARSQMMLVEDPNLYTATPAESPPDQWPARATASGESTAPLPSDPVDASGRPDTFSGSAPGSECQSIEAQIRLIDERARQGHSAAEGSWLSEQRRHLREQYHALNCSER